MAKQQHKILQFHGGSNNKFDPRDIGEDQNVTAQLSVRNPGRLVMEGAGLTPYTPSQINGKTINDITGTQGFKRGYGLFSFSHDFDMETTADGSPDEIATEFIVTNDGVDIDIFDPNKSTAAWRDAQFTLGSRTSTVQPEYYNVDGGLRACDSNFGVTSTALLINMGSGVTKNDITLTHDSGTINAGSTIQINQEIMYVVTSPSSTTITVIRGYANTKITTHADDSIIYYVNVPKYFGHIKEDRLFEAATSNSINTWVEDVQTPQPPNNTRKSDGTAATLASSAGIQSLRVYDIIEGSTTNYPTESEKVVLEFGQRKTTIGITQVEASDGIITITCGDTHGLAVGEEILISNTNSTINSIKGKQIIETIDAANNKFTINIEDYDTSDVLDFVETNKISDISDWDDLTATTPNTVSVDVGDTDLPTSGQFYIQIKDQTGVPAFNGVYLATAIDNNTCSFVNASHALAGDGNNTGTVQQLIGTITVIGEDAIDEDLKRKWNFAMSFTYDGPGQEVQESLLTMGHSIVPSTLSSGVSNLMNDSGGINNSVTEIGVDDASVFTVDESVIMIGTEQMLVTGADTGASPQHIDVTRGYNNTTKATHSDDAPIFLVQELSPTATVDWTNFTTAPNCVIKSVYDYGVDEKSWNPRINGFKIYMKDVTDGDSSQEFRLFANVNLNKGTYQILAADDSELILEQPATSAIATITSGTTLKIKPIDTYLSENLFTEQTVIDAQYKAVTVVGRRAYIGNIKQSGRTYPDRMIRTAINKFDTFPETNFIDVAVGDGDEIIALHSFGDRLLQFKKKKVFVINVGGESEFLEAEYSNAGCRHRASIVRTHNGIAWINSYGLWFFDGQNVVNLTEFVQDEGYAVTGVSNELIGYEKKTNRLFFTPGYLSGMTSAWYIYDLSLKAYQSFHRGSIFPYSGSGGDNYFTNFINDASGDLVFGYVDGASSTKTELNFFKWDNDDNGHQMEPYSPFNALWLSKDMDFGSPAVDKKIYKVYVTYKSTGASGVVMKYGTNASTTQTSTFTEPASSGMTGYTTAAGFAATSGWATVELKPTSSISNVKSFQIAFFENPEFSGTATGGNGTTIVLASSHSGVNTSTTDNAYNGNNIYIYDGDGRFNSRKITDYDGDGGETGTALTVTFSSLTDKGYASSAASGSKYIMRSMDPDFEINDITIVYRIKRVK